MKTYDCLNEFYNCVSPDDAKLYAKLANIAINLGYTPSRDKTKSVSISFRNNKNKYTIMKFSEAFKNVYIWKFKFSANKNYSNIFDESIKKSDQYYRKFEEKYKIGKNTCFNCKKCENNKKLFYTIKNDDNTSYKLCGHLWIDINQISKEIIDEAEKLLEKQHEKITEDILNNYPNYWCKNLAKSLLKNGIEKDTFLQIMKSAETIPQTFKKNTAAAEWHYNAINLIDELLDPKTKHKILEDCACNLGGKSHTACKEVNKKYQTTEERITAINDVRFVFGHEIKITDKGKYEVVFGDDLKLNDCPCGRIKGLDKNKKMSITHCYCCGGYVKKHLETVLGKEVSVKVISSILSSQGKKNCKFELKEKS